MFTAAFRRGWLPSLRSSTRRTKRPLPTWRRPSGPQRVSRPSARSMIARRGLTSASTGLGYGSQIRARSIAISGAFPGAPSPETPTLASGALSVPVGLRSCHGMNRPRVWGARRGCPGATAGSALSIFGLEEDNMAPRRKRVLGLPIGPPEPAHRLRTAARVVGAGAAIGGAVLASSRVTRRGSAARSAVRDRHEVGAPNEGLANLAASPEARARAQQASIEARRRRSELQRRLKSEDVDLAEVFRIADDDDVIANTRVKILLQNLPGVGPAGAVSAMESLGIAPGRRIKGLGVQQRERLLEQFAAPA